MKILRTASLGSNFTSSYKKRVHLNRKKETKGVLYRSGDTPFVLFSDSPIVYQVINKTKLSITIFQNPSP